MCAAEDSGAASGGSATLAAMPRRNSSSHGRPGRNRSSRSRAELARLAHQDRLEAEEAGRPARVRPIVRCVNGKPGWRSEATALEVLAEVQRKAHVQPGRPVPVRVYLCEKCSSWHLTSRPFAPFRPEGE